jgi:hypothetical protein
VFVGAEEVICECGIVFSDGNYNSVIFLESSREA